MSATAPVLRLRRGVPVLPRGDGLVLVGSDPDHHVVLPDTASVARLLVQLRLGLPSAVGADGPLTPVLRTLAEAGLLVDAAEQTLLAEARTATRVRVHAPPAWLAMAEEFVRVCGLTVTPSANDLIWVVSAGEADWDLHDTLVAGDDPVLFTAVHPSRVRVGPFVLPGTTACLRCLAAQGPDLRPPRVSVREPLELPEDLSPLVLRQALLAAVSDLAEWSQGRQPRTWAATTWFDQAGVATRQVQAQHPHCGCCWNQSLTG